MGMNIGSIGAMMQALAMDNEYQRIIRELRAYGLEPVGNKSIDKARLNAVKEAKEVENNQPPMIEPVTKTTESDKNRYLSAEDNVKNEIPTPPTEMIGAEQIAQLNKFKILGLY